MEAGNRCFDQRVPEEINRRIVDHTADINLTYSDIAREYLLREGLPPDRVIKTGSPMFEVLAHYRKRIETSDARERLGVATGQHTSLSARTGKRTSILKSISPNWSPFSTRWPRNMSCRWWFQPIRARKSASTPWALFFVRKSVC